MPNRIIKHSICKSESIKQLTWFEEVFFYRLIVNCDDYGRADARLDALASELFPVRRDVTLKQVEAALNKLVTVGMVRVYEYDRQPFLQLRAWERHQTIRNQKSKYPAPPPEDCEQLQTTVYNCMQLQANVPVIQSNPNPNPNPNPIRESKSKRASAQEDDLAVFGDELRLIVRDWFAYKAEKNQSYKPTGRKMLISEIRKNAEKYGDNAVIEAIRKSMSSNYQGIVWDLLKNTTQRTQGGKVDTLGVLEQMLHEEEAKGGGFSDP